MCPQIRFDAIALRDLLPQRVIRLLQFRGSLLDLSFKILPGFLQLPFSRLALGDILDEAVCRDQTIILVEDRLCFFIDLDGLSVGPQEAVFDSESLSPGDRPGNRLVVAHPSVRMSLIDVAFEGGGAFQILLRRYTGNVSHTRRTENAAILELVPLPMAETRQTLGSFEQRPGLRKRLVVDRLYDTRVRVLHVEPRSTEIESETKARMPRPIFRIKVSWIPVRAAGRYSYPSLLNDLIKSGLPAATARIVAQERQSMNLVQRIGPSMERRLTRPRRSA